MTTQGKFIDKTSTEFKADQVLTISSGHFIHDIYTAFVAPLLPLIIEKFSLTLTMAGALTAMLQIPGLLNPVIGYLDDKVSLRFFVILAPAVTATLMSSLGLAPNYWSLAILMLLTGISVAAFHAPAPAMIGRISGNRVGTGMSVFMAFGELARTVGPMIAVWAVSLWSLEGIYRLMILGWGISLVLYWRFREIPGHTTQSGSLRSVAPQLLRFFVPLSIIVLLRMFLAVCLTTFLPTYLVQQGFELKAAGFFLAILELAGVGGALLSGTISDRFGRRVILMFVTLGSSLLTLLFLQVRGLWLVPVLLADGFTTLSTGPLFLALVQDHLPKNRAVGNGLFLSISFLLRSLAMVLIGAAGDRIGLEAAFFWSAISSLLVIPVIPILPRTSESNKHDSR